MASAATIKIAATANVMRIPVATAAGSAVVISLAAVASANTAPMTDALALVQVIAFLLNILPVPGLDGYGVLDPYLPERARRVGAKVRPWAPLVLLVLIISLNWLGALFFATGEALFSALGGDPEAAGYGYSAFMFWRN